MPQAMQFANAVRLGFQRQKSRVCRPHASQTFSPNKSVMEGAMTPITMYGPMLM